MEVQAGITEVLAEVLPASKAEYIKKHQKGGAMVGAGGDWVNDFPELAAADVGMAIGGGGFCPHAE